MAGAREIRSKIKSIQNTQKITKAMEMVAASKMRKAQDRMRAGRPYAQKIWKVITHLAHAHSEYYHPFLIPREEVRRVGLIVISTDRGLCGGLNTNLFRTVVQAMKDWDSQGIGIDVCTVGAKAGMLFSRIGANVIAHVSHLGDHPRLQDLVGAGRVIVEAYRDEKIDRLFLFSNSFINSLTQRPTMTQLLPLEPAKEDWLKHRWDYIYEPEAQEVLDHLLQRYLESLVYQAVIENAASEQAARMVAMKAASDNAGDLIEELKLIYNKARQASITRELAEIVGGAAAV